MAYIEGGSELYGVSADLDLSAFVGLAVVQIRLGEYQFQVALHPEGNLAIEARFELFDPVGQSLESGTPEELAGSSHLGVLLGSKVTTAVPEPPSAVAFTFSSGHLLRLFDSESHYESFTLDPGPIIV